MKKKTLGIICVLIFITSLGSGCISFSSEKNSYYYSLNLVAEHPFEYNVYAPIAYDGDIDSVEKILSHIRIIEGTCHFEIIWTEYGPALNIKSNDTIYLISELQDDEEYHPIRLSMPLTRVGDDTKDHWIFFISEKQETLEVNISLKAEAGGCCAEIREEHTRPDFQNISGGGWNKITTFYSIIS
jgi:hypothetical protein